MTDANEVTATGGQDKTADNINNMVLMSEEWRKSNEKEPKQHHRSHETAQVAGVGVDQ